MSDQSSIDQSIYRKYLRYSNVTDLASDVSQIVYKVSGIGPGEERAASETALEALRDMVEKPLLGSGEGSVEPVTITAAQAVLAEDAPLPATEVVSALLDLGL